MTEPPPTPTARPGLAWAVCLALAAAVLAVYWPVHGFGFVDYDDPDYFSANPHVFHGLTWNGVVWAFTTYHASNWHPVTWLSLMLDAQLFGPGAAGPHLANLLLHAVNTVILFLFLRRLTGALWRSALVAALFGLHPLHVESVAWISERKDVLSTLFGLLALWTYTIGADRNKTGQRSAFHWLTVLFFALGLLSKPMLVTLPLVMVLLDYWPVGRFTRPPGRGPLAELLQSLRKKIVFLVLAAISCVATYVAQSKGGAVQTLEQFPFGARLANAVVACVLYLWKTIWPFDLAYTYVQPGGWLWTAVLPSAVLVAGLCAAAWWRGRTHRVVFTGWFWFLGMLVPVLGLVQVGVQSMADRYTYLPHVGLFIIFSWAAAKTAARSPALRLVIAAVMAAILVGCALRTRDQLACWQNSETLFRHACAVTRNNYIALNNLGLWLFNHGQTDEAMACYQEAIRANPGHVKSLNNLGNIYSQRGDYATAIQYFEDALQRKPDFSEVWYDYGNTLFKMGRYDEAIARYRRALELNPMDATGYNNLGLTLTMVHRGDEALTNFQRALDINPDYAGALVNLGTALLQRRQFDPALDCFRRATRVTPENTEFQLHLAGALTLAGKYNEAIEQYQQVVQRQPGLATARIGMGNALAAAGRWEDAAHQFQEALRRDADNPKTHMRLGIVLEQLGRKPEAAAEFREVLRLQPDNEDANRALKQLEESSGQ